LLGWSISILAGKAGASATTVSDFENGKRQTSVLNNAKIRKAFENAGVEFVGEAGTRLKNPQ
jgi:transcriptional regulator with XRE-family HTH domain